VQLASHNSQGGAHPWRDDARLPSRGSQTHKQNADAECNECTMHRQYAGWVVCKTMMGQGAITTHG